MHVRLLLNEPAVCGSMSAPFCTSDLDALQLLQVHPICKRCRKWVALKRLKVEQLTGRPVLTNDQDLRLVPDDRLLREARR